MWTRLFLAPSQNLLSYIILHFDVAFIVINSIYSLFTKWEYASNEYVVMIAISSLSLQSSPAHPFEPCNTGRRVPHQQIIIFATF